MKGIAAIAILGGALQIVNAVMEATAATKGSPSATWLLAIGLVVVVSLMLVGAGVAMLAGSRNAISLAKLSGVACIVSVALTRFIAPWMGGFAMLVGVVFPLAVLAYVWTRRSGSSTRMA